MAVIEYDEYKQKLLAMEETYVNLHKALGIDAAKAEIERLMKETEEDGFWNDVARAQKNQQQTKQLQNKVNRQNKLITDWEDLTVLCEMGQEEDDPDLLEEQDVDPYKDVLGLEEYRKHSELFAEDLYEAIDLMNCVQKRISEGGTSVASVKQQIEYVKQIINQ